MLPLSFPLFSSAPPPKRMEHNLHHPDRQNTKRSPLRSDGKGIRLGYTCFTVHLNGQLQHLCSESTLRHPCVCSLHRCCRKYICCSYPALHLYINSLYWPQLARALSCNSR
eukprot:jgi/Botrbrau1/15388/Bobra.43_2s0016.1